MHADCFNSRSTTRLEAEEFLAVFNEARNQKEAFFTASQRLTDFSKTIRTKQVYCIGKIPEEDKVLGVRRIEKHYKIDFARVPSRTWFFEGKTFKSPEWKQKGKPHQVNKEIKKNCVEALKPQQPKRSLLQAIKTIFHGFDTFLSLPVSKPKSNNKPQDEDPDEDTELNAIMAETDQEDEEFFWA